MRHRLVTHKFERWWNFLVSAYSGCPSGFRERSLGPGPHKKACPLQGRLLLTIE
jgi:hypothetical protein